MANLIEVAGPDGLLIYIDYNGVNLRVGNISFTIPTGFVANVMLWNQGQVVYDAQYPAGTYSEAVPGNYRLTEGQHPDGEVYYLLPEIDWYVSLVPVP